MALGAPLLALDTLLFISVAFPDGTFLLRGPVGGRSNDLNILKSYGLMDDLPTLFHGWAIGGDGLFPVSALLHSNKIFDALVDPADRAAYAQVRISVCNIFHYFQLKLN